MICFSPTSPYLTSHWSACPTWLNNAQKKLDSAVFAAYGWPEDLSDEEMLKRLLALNQDRSGTATSN